MSLDTIALSRSPLRARIGSKRSATYIWLAAAMERYYKAVVYELVNVINAEAVPLCDLRLSLMSMAISSKFDAAHATKGVARWSKRTEIFASISHSQAAVLSSNDSHLPIDGRTIRAKHVQALWDVFGLPGPSIPGKRHTLALKDLADGRNQLAHGQVDPEDYGRRKVTKDLLRLIDVVDDILIHVDGAVEAYCQSQGWCR